MAQVFQQLKRSESYNLLLYLERHLNDISMQRTKSGILSVIAIN